MLDQQFLPRTLPPTGIEKICKVGAVFINGAARRPRVIFAHMLLFFSTYQTKE